MLPPDVAQEVGADLVYILQGVVIFLCDRMAWWFAYYAH